jgi:hypothetical protein
MKKLTYLILILFVATSCMTTKQLWTPPSDTVKYHDKENDQWVITAASNEQKKEKTIPTWKKVSYTPFTLIGDLGRVLFMGFITAPFRELEPDTKDEKIEKRAEFYEKEKKQDPEKAKHNATYDYYWKHGVEKDD